MQNNLAGVLNILLSQPNTSLDIQQRILAHGIKTKDFNLLSRLASHPALDPSVDDGLRDVNSAMVKTAWVSRKGRTADQITQMVQSEKRVTVLSALVQSENLPPELYRSIVERTDNATVLSAVQTNQTIPVEVREAAAVKQITVEAEQPNYGDTLDWDRVSKISRIVERTPTVATALYGSGDDHILVALAVTVVLPDDMQLKVVKRFVKRYGKLVNTDRDMHYYNSPLSHMVSFIDSFSDLGSVCDEAANLLDEQLAQILTKATGYAQNRINDLRTTLGRSKPSGVLMLQQRQSEIDSVESMTAFVRDIDTAKAAGKLDFPERLLPDVAQAVISSPYADSESIASACSWYGWGSSQMDAVRAAGRADSEKIATVISNLYWIDIDEALDGVDNPTEVVDILLRRNLENNDRHRRGITYLMDSKHFAPELIRRMPIAELLTAKLEASHINALETELRTLIGDDQAWNNFVTLSEEFEGSLAELVTIARTL